ncbi:hypothetical protein GF322_03685 [Candidatus Dependentiae bacterium]|nr:hypothetical protein [Candidatus Dependentiae bacterium]
MKRINILIIYLIIKTISISTILSQKMIVCVPVTDLRAHPSSAPSQAYGLVLYPNNPEQRSQLLLNEKVIALQQKDDWTQVKAIEQPKSDETHEKICEYQTGWVPSSHLTHVNEFPKFNIVIKEQWAMVIKTVKNTISLNTIYLSIGTKLEVIKKIYENFENLYHIKLPNNEKGIIEEKNVKELNLHPQEEEKFRQEIITTAGTFINTPYSWGGRSGYDNTAPYQTGVDCSGFINLVYRVNGMDIPRNAHDQYLACRQIESFNLKKGDFIFFGKNQTINMKKSLKINHIMMCWNSKYIIESSGEAPTYKNRIISAEERFGKPLHQLKNGDLIGNQTIYFGTLINNFSHTKTNTTSKSTHI